MINKISQKVIAGFFTSMMFLSQLPAEYDERANCCEDYCNSCDSCASNSFWFDAEYLYWKIKDCPEHTPLVIEGPHFEPALGQPNTKVILGGKNIDNKWRSGGKFGLGYWFDDERLYGVEANYFFLPKRSTRGSVGNPGTPGTNFLGVPFFNVTTSNEDSFTLSNSDPSIAEGAWSGFAIFTMKNRMQGAELNGFFPILTECSHRIGLLGGFRYWNFKECFTFATQSPLIKDPVNIYSTKDKFDVNNNFYGGQIGIEFDYNTHCFTVNVKGKVALGANCGNVDIDGVFLTNNFSAVPFTGTPQAVEGGIFALPTNIGNHHKTFFCVLPEVSVNLGYQIWDDLKLQVGYSFLYASNALRAGRQINRNINPTQSGAIEESVTPILVGEPSPKPWKRSQGLWAQGLNVGIQYTF